MIFSRTLSKFVIATALVISLNLGFISPSYAQPKRTMWDTFQLMMGWKKPDIGPQDTLVAPFAEESVKPITRDNNDTELPINSVPLHVPHRSNREISSWLSQTVMSSLEMDKDKIKNINSILAESFTKDAADQFMEFGQKSNVFSSVFYGDGRQLVSYGKSSPILVKADPVPIPMENVSMYTGIARSTLSDPTLPEGSIEDIQSLRDTKDTNIMIYQWVFQVPATLSLLEEPIETYNTKKSIADTQKQRDIVFCITVSRSPLNPTDGVLISNWEVGNCD